MKYLRNLIWGAFLISCICSCKNEPKSQTQTSEPIVSTTPKAKTSNADIYSQLNLSDEQKKAAANVERRFLRAKRKLIKEKNWAGPENRPNRAKHSRAQKKAFDRVLGPKLSKQYLKLLEAKSKN